MTHFEGIAMWAAIISVAVAVAVNVIYRLRFTPEERGISDKGHAVPASAHGRR